MGRKRLPRQISVFADRIEVTIPSGETALFSPQDSEIAHGVPFRMASTRRRLIADQDGSTISIARLIIKAPRDRHVDHINGNILDNRRDNLRLCTQLQNNRNRRAWRSDATIAPFKGVKREGRKWYAHITVNYKRIHLGSFSDAHQAALAYDAAARSNHGAFATLNFPNDGERSAFHRSDI
jgi:hypothetical protein